MSLKCARGGVSPWCRGRACTNPPCTRLKSPLLLVYSAHVRGVCCACTNPGLRTLKSPSLSPCAHDLLWCGMAAHSKHPQLFLQYDGAMCATVRWLHSAQTQITQGRSPARCRPLVVHQEVHREDGVTSGSPRPPLAGSPHPPG